MNAHIAKPIGAEELLEVFAAVQIGCPTNTATDRGGMT